MEFLRSSAIIATGISVKKLYATEEESVSLVEKSNFEKIRCEAVWGKPIVFAQDKQTIVL